MTPEEVQNCTVFETLAGSKAYGTSTPESDTDIRGVCIPPDPAEYLGMRKPFEQKDKEWLEDDDKVIYDFRKAIRLMAAGNPNMIELLFTDPKHWIKCYKPWWRVIEKRELFLSKQMRKRYGGYAYSQLGRIKRHRGWLMNPPKGKPTRAQFDLPERKLINEGQAGAYQWLLAKILHGSLEVMKISEATREELYGINFIGAVQSGVPDECAQVIKDITGASDHWIEAVMREKRYEKAMKDWNSYEDWKTERNPKRQAIEAKWGYDTKHAMHLVRLMRMGIEILRDGEVLVFRPDAEELLEIRNGSWSYDEVVQFAEDSENEMKALSKTSTLPEEPDREAIEALCVDIIQREVFND